MTDILRNNWFVVLIAIIIIGFIGYFIYDTNKDNVSAKSSNNEQVVASIDKDDITANDLYDESAPYDGSTIYNMYKNAVIDQSIETTKDIKKQANTLESNIKSNASKQSDDYESTLTSELAKYGYSSFEQLNDYCITSVKEKEMNKKYITKHFCNFYIGCNIPCTNVVNSSFFFLYTKHQCSRHIFYINQISSGNPFSINRHHSLFYDSI